MEQQPPTRAGGLDALMQRHQQLDPALAQLADDIDEVGNPPKP